VTILKELMRLGYFDTAPSDDTVSCCLSNQIHSLHYARKVTVKSYLWSQNLISVEVKGKFEVGLLI